ncbi:hypothetical protein ACFWVF_10615 [Streptomyces sp. NPDC058659]|uniref:hypothetical protein n=1 Tax=unclassified Streptomyces TaxID=2593676 RepID=UPI003648EB8A
MNPTNTANTANTATLQSTANPRRSTLVHLEDAAQLGRGALPEYATELPGQTANPRRTVLMTAPAPYEPAPYASASR